jgi:CBS domain-containing protein
MTRLVRDLMHPGVISCPPESTLGQAAGLLAQHRLHAIVVAESLTRPLGILSDFDLLAGEWLSSDSESLETMRRMTAGELMSAPAVTIEAGATAAEASRLMLQEHIHRLLVLEQGVAVGMISPSDFIAGLVEAPRARGKVADVMSRGLVVCREGTSLAAVARAMTERRSRSVVMVDRQGKPLGVVTGIDVLAACRDGCGDQTVDSFMHPPITTHPEASLQSAADQMIRHHIHRLLVVEEGKPSAMPLGLISTSDIVLGMARAESVWQA